MSNLKNIVVLRKIWLTMTVKNAGKGTFLLHAKFLFKAIRSHFMRARDAEDSWYFKRPRLHLKAPRLAQDLADQPAQPTQGEKPIRRGLRAPRG